MTLNENNLLTPEQACEYLNLMKEEKDTEGKITKIPDLDAINRRRRANKFKVNWLSEREWRVYKSELDTYLKGDNHEDEPENSTSHNEDALVEKQKKIDLIAKDKELYIKNLEFETYKAGFPTLVDYKASVDDFLKQKEALELEIKVVAEREHAVDAVENNLYAREQVLQKRLDDINAEREQILAEARKQADELLARTKVEVKKMENSEYDNMKWAVQQFEDIILIINNWGFQDYSDKIDGRLSWIVDELNKNTTLQDLWGDFKYITNIASNLIEYTQNRKRDADKFFELRNQLGEILKGIIVTLHLDDERRGNTQTPALPLD